MRKTTRGKKKDEQNAANHFVWGIGSGDVFAYSMLNDARLTKEIKSCRRDVVRKNRVGNGTATAPESLPEAFSATSHGSYRMAITRFIFFLALHYLVLAHGGRVRAALSMPSVPVRDSCLDMNLCGPPH